VLTAVVSHQKAAIALSDEEKLLLRLDDEE
jgi:hypothetical protein